MVPTDIFVHEKALVESPQIGDGSRIWAFVHILKGARIGRNANICDQCFVENDVVIGDNVTVKCGVYIWDGVTIEDNVQVGPGAAFTNDLYPRAKNAAFQLARTLLRSGCSIGANAVLLAGHTIGLYALVGAGAVVTKNVPDFAIAVGNPARVIGYVCVCSHKMTFVDHDFTCPDCSRRFTKTADGVRFMAMES